MGGHGGLNILPQKRWNVYNFDNRERVRKDEEAAAQEEQLKRQKARQADLEFKLEALREVNRSKRRRVEQIEGSEGASSSLEGRVHEEGAIVVRESTQHINLFAEFEARAEAEGLSHGGGQDRAPKGSRKGGEERESRRGREEGSRKDRNAWRGVEKVDGKPTGEPVNENYGLGHGVLDKNGKKPWYTYKSFMVDRTSTADGEQRKSDSKSDSKLPIAGSSENDKDKTKKKTVEELRAERLKREQQEKSKVRRLVSSQAARSSTGYNALPNGRVPQYHGSYGNGR